MKSTEFKQSNVKNADALNAKILNGHSRMNSMEPKKQQIEILEKYNKNNPQEHDKLSSLFHTLHKLEKFYRIDLVDFQDNIMDTGDRYVLVDLGF